MITIDTFQTISLARPFERSYWVIPTRFLAGEYPGSLLMQEAHEKISALLNLGIDTYIDLTLADHLDPYTPILKTLADCMGKKVQYLKMGFRDLSVPSRRDMIRILDAIENAIDEGHNVYVHCWGGIGRTGTVVGCYLARHGVTGEAALQEIEQMRVVVPSSRPSPETNEQRKMVFNWPVNQ